MSHSCKRFEGKSVVITAATAGIGLGIAQRLGEEGARLTICSRKQVLCLLQMHTNYLDEFAGALSSNAFHFNCSAAMKHFECDLKLLTTGQCR